MSRNLGSSVIFIPFLDLYRTIELQSIISRARQVHSMLSIYRGSQSGSGTIDMNCATCDERNVLSGIVRLLEL